ncbi:Glyoxalase/Bleomycin resistance protein/Dioxygenase superfamily [Spongiibacter sp. IMCC21906]|uniref:VOC family protein n=1 Tax=Spongiibacter sp. IMCC21906 TaxID=1620392 RepID=UPI00062DEA14|nr:VOC family protein [Spongiibacter sp. IMCC21906]AKH68095.1 Glyoxalase/Bleomycin resistance protein/Dioxygenase superfamily [Spongiibacter sp. IMCC21906]
MAKVTELGYMGLSISDADAWKSYATSCLGMELLESEVADTFYLRMDYWHHRIELRVGSEDDLAYLGWRVAGAAELSAMAVKLSEAGIAYKVGSSAEAKERRVLGLIKTRDPAGVPTEIFYGPQVDGHLPLYPGRRMHSGFVTDDMGMGHALVASDDPIASYKFYELLGLSGSIEYHLKTPDGVAKPIFMHCNNRQHSIAFGVPSQKLLNHFMIEYRSLDDLGMAHDIIRTKKIDVALNLGKHANDQALTFYSATPSGWLMELGWGGVVASSQQQYHENDVFGHQIEASGMGLDVEL